jgi:predicted PurR-regulated permease PerM
VIAAQLMAKLSGEDVTAIVVSVVGGILLIGALLAIASLMRTLRSLRAAVEQLQRDTIPLVANLQTTVRRANEDLERVDRVLESVESISVTVDSASRLAYLTFSNPVVKGLAFASGTARAVRRMRRD